MAGLPLGWEWDYDGTRWFYTYKPTGHVQYHFPKEGDEFPDFVDAGAPAPSLAPEELLASQQQVKRQTSTGNSSGRNKARVSATATRPVSNVWDEASGEDAIFQPESLMYLGPGTYNDVSPLAEEEDEAARRVITGALAEADGTSTSASKGPSPIVSQGATPAVKKSDVVPPKTDSAVHIVDAGPVIEVEVNSGVDAEQAVPMLDSREMPHELPVEVFNPVGVIAEMASEMTQRAHIETNPPPVEIADNTILAPIETVLPPKGISELAERTSPTDNNKKPTEPGGISIQIPKSQDTEKPVQIQQPPPRQPTPQQQQQQQQEPSRTQPPIESPPIESPPVEKQPDGPSSKYQAFSIVQGSTSATEKMESTRRTSMALDPRRISVQREPSLLGLGKNDNKMDPSMVPAALSLSKPSGASPERSPPFQPTSGAMVVESIDVSTPSDGSSNISSAVPVLKPVRNGDGRKLSDSNNSPSHMDSEFERTMQMALSDKPGVSKVPSVLKPARGRAPSLQGKLAADSRDGSRNQSPAQTTPRRSYEQGQDEAGAAPKEKQYLPYTGIRSGYRMSQMPPPAPGQGQPPHQFGSSPPPQGLHQPPQNPPAFYQGPGPIQQQPGFQQGAIPPHLVNMPRPASTPVGPMQPPAGAPPMQPQQWPSNYPHVGPPQGPPRTVASRRSMSISAADVSPIQSQSGSQSPQVPMQTPSPMERVRRVSSVSLAGSLDPIFTPSPDTGPSAPQSQVVSPPGTRPPSGLRNFSSPPQDGVPPPGPPNQGPPRPGKVPIDQGSYFPPQPAARENFQPQPGSKRLSMPPSYSINDSNMDWMQEAGRAPIQPSPPVPAKVPENPPQGLHRSQSVGSSGAPNVQPPRRLEPGRMGPVQQHGAGFVLSMIEEHHEPPPSRHGPPGNSGFMSVPGAGPPPPNGPGAVLPPYPVTPAQQYQQLATQAPYPLDNGAPVMDRVQVPPATPPVQLPPLTQTTPLEQILPSRHESLRRHVSPQAQMQAAQNQTPLQRHTSLREQSSHTSQVMPPAQPLSTHQGSVGGQPHVTHGSPQAHGFRRQGSLRGPKLSQQSQPAPSHPPTGAPQGRPQTPPESPPQAQGQMPQVSPLNLGNPSQAPMPPHGQIPPQGQMHLQGQMPHGQAPPHSRIPPQGQMPPHGQPPQGRPQPQAHVPPQALTPQNQQPLRGQAPPQGHMPPQGQMTPQGQMRPQGPMPPHDQMAQMHISPHGQPPHGQPPYRGPVPPPAQGQFYSPAQVQASHGRKASNPNVFMSPGAQASGFSPNPQQGSPGFQPSGGRPGANSPQPMQGPPSKEKEKDRKWTKWFKSSKSGPQIKHMHIQHIPNPPGPQSQGLQSPLQFGPNPNQIPQAPGYQPGNVPIIKQDHLPSQPTAAPLLTPSASPNANAMASNRASTESQTGQKSPSLAPQQHAQGRQSPSESRFQLHPGTPLGSHPPNGPGYRSPELRPKDGSSSPKSSIASLPPPQHAPQHAETPQPQPNAAPTYPVPAPIMAAPPMAAPTTPAPSVPTYTVPAPIMAAPTMAAPTAPAPTQPPPAQTAPMVPAPIISNPTVPTPIVPAPLTSLPMPMAPDAKRDAAPPAPKSAPLPGAQVANGEKKDKWTKTPAVDYTGDDWGSDDDEWR